jgi:hypothetical protein
MQKNQAMDYTLSRRGLLKNLAVASAVPLAGDAEQVAAQDAGPGVTPPRPEDLVRLDSGDLRVTFNRLDGSIWSLENTRDELHTNFVGNASNTRGLRLHDPFWTGHVISTVWESGQSRGARRGSPWSRQTTVESSDNRRTSFDGTSFIARYEGKSSRPGGIESYDLRLDYRPAAGNSLMLEISVRNTTGRLLEIGEFSLPLRANDDYVEAYGGLSLRQAIDQGRLGAIQQTIYEQKILGHHFAGGYSSYALLERPRGTPPFLLFQAIDAPVECVYKVEGFHPWRQDWIGTDLLGLHTWAVRELRDWSENPWVNGHTSLLLEPGQSKSWSFRFTFLDSYQKLPDELFDSGALAIRVLPSMVVQEATDVLVEVRSKTPLDKVELHAGGIEIKSNRRVGDLTLLTMTFHGRGQKTLKLIYAGDKWTNLHFYCLESYEQLIKARARFVIDREFYENPADPFQRNHIFLPFDTRKGVRLEDMDDVSEVGGAGDSGFGDPLFLSEKNVYFPSQEEISVLETYVTDALFQHLQNPQTYEIRSSLYWRDPHYPSMGQSGTKARSEATTRAYNYIFVGNVYHALYRIGKEYGLLKRRTPEQYLEMAYRTYVKGYETGPYRHMGLITGSNALHILADLKTEGWEQPYNELLARMKECNEEFVKDPYPYGSEIEIDHTGQEQVYFFSRYFGNAEKRRKTVDIDRALKGAMQPVWFRYGVDLFAHPDLRSEICCWHSSAMNAMVLMQESEDTGEMDLLTRAYPGHVSVMTNVTTEGAGYGWFMCTPGVYGHEPPRTFENGPAMWAFLRGAKAHVIDDSTFGVTGLGCQAAESGGEIVVVPNDGVRKRIRFVTRKIDLRASSGEFEKVTLGREGSSLRLEMGDSTGLVKTARVTVQGLDPGQYDVQYQGRQERVTVGDALHVQAPITAAGRIEIHKV